MGEILYFRAVYLTANGTALDTSLPLMIYEDEILENVGSSVTSRFKTNGLVCKSGNGSIPSWYHPFGVAVQSLIDLKLTTTYTLFAQIFWTDSTKLVYLRDRDLLRSHRQVYGIYTCRINPHLPRDVVAIGVFRRYAGNLATPKKIPVFLITKKKSMRVCETKRQSHHVITTTVQQFTGLAE